MKLPSTEKSGSVTSSQCKVYGSSRTMGAGPDGETLLRIFNEPHDQEVNTDCRKVSGECAGRILLIRMDAILIIPSLFYTCTGSAHSASFWLLVTSRVMSQRLSTIFTLSGQTSLSASFNQEADWSRRF